jgi:hypothetical protein
MMDIRDAIKEHEEHIKELKDEVRLLRQEKESILAFHERFILLEETLRKDCNIDLRKDLVPFTKVFNDFKEKRYDVASIFNLYEKASKIEWDIKTNENQIQAHNNQLSWLQQEIRSSQSRLDTHGMLLDLYEQLKAMKFGIDELKQLWLTVSEATPRGDSLKDFDRCENPVAFFMKDVEENYHDKLKFEDRVNAKRDELVKLNVQVSEGRQALLLQPFIGSTLFSLFKTGISEQDMVEMNHIFSDSQNILDLPSDDSRIEEIQSNASGSKDTKGWKKLSEELRKYGGLKAAVKEQNDQLRRIEKEYSSLVYQAQTLGIVCQNLVNFINFSYASISHYHQCKTAMDAHYREMDTHRLKNNRILIPLVILLTKDLNEDIDKRKTPNNDVPKEDHKQDNIDNNNGRKK